MAKEFARKLYNSKNWKNKRAEIFAANYGICQICEGVGAEVHHIKHLSPENIEDPEITLGSDNLILLCKECHFAQHKAEAFKSNKRKRLINDNWTYFNDKGETKSVEIKIIYGCIASGKSKYINEHIKSGDIVIDIDLLKKALSGGEGDPRTNELDHLTMLSLSIRDYIINLIKNRDKSIEGYVIYIVGLFPNKKNREAMAADLRAELIHIDSSIKDCIDHMMNDDDRIDKELQRSLIIEYFEKFER